MSGQPGTLTPGPLTATTVPGRTTSPANVLRSEWTKLRSVRSTAWTLLAAFVVGVGFGAMTVGFTVAYWDQMPARARAQFDPTSSSLGGLGLALLAFAILGVLAVSGEYSTGMIRTSLTAVPRRLMVYAAKIAVFGVLALVWGLLISAVAFFLGQAIFGIEGLGVSITDPGVGRAVVGGGLYLAAGGLFGLGFGALLRHTAGAISVVAGALLVVPPMLQLLPGTWGENVYRYFTTNAGGAVIYPRPPSTMLAPWAGFGVFCGYVVVALAVGAYLLRRRDA